MAAVHTTKNQYRGINAHFHSYWQTEGGWDSFHSSHIIYLTSALKAKLLPMGYTAEVEQSLQIRRYVEPESDVILLDTNPERFFQRPSPSMISAQQALAIPDVIDIEEELAPYRATNTLRIRVTGVNLWGGLNCSRLQISLAVRMRHPIAPNVIKFCKAASSLSNWIILTSRHQRLGASLPKRLIGLWLSTHVRLFWKGLCIPLNLTWTNRYQRLIFHSMQMIY